MPKQLLFDQAAREALRKGVQKVADAVRPTLGPRGRTVVIDKSWGAPTITKDGVSVCEEVELTDPYENMAAKMIKEAASKTSDQAGDGTTTSAVLAEAIFLEGIRIVTSGGNPIALSRGIKRASDAVIEQLKKLAEPLDVKDKNVLEQIGTLAAGNDPGVGEMLAQAFSKVGKEGAISVEEGKGIQTEIKIVEGMQFDRGFLSPHFVTNPASVECVLENPYILLFEEKLSPASQIIPLLEKVAAEKRPLLVVAEDVEGEALATLVVNKLRGIFQACAVKAPVPAATLRTTSEGSTPAFWAITRIGFSIARRTMSTPSFSSPSSLSESSALPARSSATPPPGTTPSSSAARTE